eukprot:scaffold13484_cov63-Phaeocystis_antarctica.AAC.2
MSSLLYLVFLRVRWNRCISLPLFCQGSHFGETRDLLLPFAVHLASVLACWKKKDAHLLDELLYFVAVDCARFVGVVQVEKHLKLRLVDGHGLLHNDCLKFLKVHSAGALGQRFNRPRGCLARAQHLGNPEQGGKPVAPMGEGHRKCSAAH